MKRGQHKSVHRWRVMGAFGKGSKRKQFEPSIRLGSESHESPCVPVTGVACPRPNVSGPAPYLEEA